MTPEPEEWLDRQTCPRCRGTGYRRVFLHRFVGERGTYADTEISYSEFSLMRFIGKPNDYVLDTSRPCECRQEKE
jgi:predicted nucleic acid-binding Zn finger protein